MTLPALTTLALAVALTVASSGCRPLTVVDRAQSDYEGGDYEDAVERLNDAETLYTNGELPPDYELRYLAYRGLSYYKLAEETKNKGYRRKGRPFVRRALERWKASEQARSEGWLEPAVVEALEAASRSVPGGADEAGEGESASAPSP